MNFVVVPAVVVAMFWALPADRAVRVGVLLVLLCPCVDYVIVFCGLAGGSSHRLLAVTPRLLVVQMLLLPVWLYAFLGPDLSDIVKIGPFLTAFLFLIVIPLILAWSTQAWAERATSVQPLITAATGAMVPLMTATLILVVASQLPEVGGNLHEVVGVVPFYVAFLVVMAFAGVLVARVYRLDIPASRAIVEVLGMVTYVRLVPRLLPSTGAPSRSRVR